MKVGELSRRMKEREEELKSVWQRSLKELEKSLNATMQNALKRFKSDMEEIELSFRSEIDKLRSELGVERWKWLAIGIGMGLAIGIVIGAVGMNKLKPLPEYWKVIRGEDGGTYIVPVR